MKYTQIPVDTFESLQLNAGILVDDFNPSTGVVGNLLGATTGGTSFASAPEYSDYGEDIDNCPKNMLELKKMDDMEITLSGTFVTITATTAKSLIGAADIDEDDATHVIPRKDLERGDFKDLWWVGDYSDINNGDNAGFVAIHMMNTLSTGGFAIQSTDNGKGNFAFTYTAHFSMANQNQVPFELFIVKGEAGEVTYSVTQELDEHITSDFSDTSVVEGTALEVTLTADTDYRVDTVTVKMSGITLPNAYDATTNKVTIASVTGNVVITATSTSTGA